MKQFFGLSILAIVISAIGASACDYLEFTRSDYLIGGITGAIVGRVSHAALKKWLKDEY